MHKHRLKRKDGTYLYKKECKCGTLLDLRTKNCSNCKSDKILNTTLGEYRNRISVRGKHPSWLSSHIRVHCRSFNKNLLIFPCQNCNYNKHVELCHIKAVSTFSNSSTIREVNSPENIIVLCRNCHWEFDNNFLVLKSIKRRETIETVSIKRNYSRIGKTKITWPSPEEMRLLIWQKSTVKLSKELGISDKAIEKFCKKHQIQKPPRGYWNKKSLALSTELQGQVC